MKCTTSFQMVQMVKNWFQALIGLVLISLDDTCKPEVEIHQSRK